IAATHGVRSRGGVAEGFKRVVFVQLQTVLFENIDADDGIAGGGRIYGKDLSLEISVVIDARGHDQLLVDAAAPSQKNDEVIFLRIFALSFGPGDDVVGIVEDEVVFAADEVAQQSRGVGNGIDLNADFFFLQKAF